MHVAALQASSPAPTRVTVPDVGQGSGSEERLHVLSQVLRHATRRFRFVTARVGTETHMPSPSICIPCMHTCLRAFQIASTVKTAAGDISGRTAMCHYLHHTPGAYAKSMMSCVCMGACDWTVPCTYMYDMWMCQGSICVEPAGAGAH